MSDAQVSTPAIDSQGNMYVVEHSLIRRRGADPTADHGRLNLIKYDSNGEFVWLRKAGQARPYRISAPKLIEIGGKLSLFVQSFGDTGYEIMAFDGEGNGHAVYSCAPSLRNQGIGGSTPTIPTGPPWPEDPTLAITLDDNGSLI